MTQHLGLLKCLSMFVILGIVSCTSSIPIKPTSSQISSKNTPLIPTNTSLPPTNTSTPTESPTPTTTETPFPSPTFTPTINPTILPTESPTITPTATKVPQGRFLFNEIVNFFIHLGTGGPVGCGDSLVYFGTGLIRTGNIQEDVKLALNHLFANPKYVGELFNATYSSRLRVTNVEYKKSSGHITIYLSGSFVKPKDNCDKDRYRVQVWQTVYQFTEISKASIYVGKYLLGDLLVHSNK